MRATPVLLLLVLAGGCRPASPGVGRDAALASEPPLPQAEPPRKGPEMDALREKVLEGKLSATALAKGIGPSANFELLQLAVNPTPRVRQIALACLAETGGPEAARALARGTLDTDPMVRIAAFRGLRQHPDPAALPDMMSALDKGTDGMAKQQVALTFGQTPGASAEALKTHCEKETDPAASEGCTVALAKLGDPDARAAFIAHLQSSSGPVRARWLEHCDYVHDPWLLKPLTAVVGDREPLVRIGADGMPGPQSLRACDLATNLVGKLSGHAFTFPMAPGVNYTDPQLVEVSTFLRALP